MTAAARIAAVLARWDSPGMRLDLAYWYDVTIDEVNELAKGINEHQV